MLMGGGMQAGWNPGGKKMGEKSSLLSEDSASSSSESRSTTDGCREVMCMRSAYANSSQIGVASWIHPASSVCNMWGGGEPSIKRVIASGWKVSSELFQGGAMAYHAEFVANHRGTCGKTTWACSVLVSSSGVLEGIVKVGGYDVDGVLGSNPEKLELVVGGLVCHCRVRYGACLYILRLCLL